MKDEMDYRSVIDYLNGFINFERLPEPRFNTLPQDLERFRAMLTELGDPQHKYPVIHIAGTKGKGSTAAILASILRESGYKTGLYTSPHLVSVRERIRVDGRMVSRRQFASLIDRIRRTAAVEPLQAVVELRERLAFRTVFEHLTAAALLEFARRRVDIAVIETGLGGKLDATVVLDPVVSVLTPIGLDHTAVLGDTIAEIAADKAHIIKPGVPAVSAPQRPEALAELKARAEKVSAPLLSAPGRKEFDAVRCSLKGTKFRASRGWLDCGELRINLAGRFQLDNLSTALTALEQLAGVGIRLRLDAVRRALAGMRWPGRLQSIPGKPPLILDGSHNTLSFEALREALDELYPTGSLRVVLTALRGKPLQRMIELLAAKAEKFHLAPLQFPKGMDAGELAEAAEMAGVRAEIHRNIPEAFESAKSETSLGQAILATGSFYLVGELLRHLRGIKPPPADGRIDSSV